MDDNEIINLYFMRSEIAIAETSRKYDRYCKSIALNILSNDEDAKECVNDVFLAAWNTIPPHQPSSLPAFLGRLTRNISLNRYDYKKAAKRNCEFDLLLSELGDIVSDSDTVEAQYEAGQVANAISVFLRKIDIESRNVFIRRYWHSESIHELSKCFQMSESKLKSMLHRTRKKLKNHLEKEGIIL